MAKTKATTKINTAFDTLYLSAHLPEEVSIKTEAAQLEINIFVDSKKVFRSVYYPYEKMVYVRDIRSIVEASMFERQLVMATLKIDVYEPLKTSTTTTVEFGSDGSETPAASVKDVKVVYCRFKSSEGSAGFLSNNFLTTRASALIPRNGQLKLSNYTKAYVQSNNRVLIYYSATDTPDDVQTYETSLGKNQSTKEDIITADLSHKYFKKMVDQGVHTDSIIKGVEYQIGGRYFNIFFTDEQPTETFKFLNAFNIMETAYLYNTTTVKTEIDRSEAVCGQQTQFYDETVKVKHEVETAPLTNSEATWLNQMLTSKLVKVLIDGYTAVPVLISDISSEVSDSDKELIRLKFTWVFVDGTEWI